VAWEKYWREDRRGSLVKHFDGIAAALESAAPEIVKLTEEAERQAEQRKREREAQEHEWERQEQERRRAQALKDSREQLLSIVEAWARARQLEDFFVELPRRRNGCRTQRQRRSNSVLLAPASCSWSGSLETLS